MDRMSQNTTYQFATTEKMDEKAAPFVQALKQMEDISDKWVRYVNDEFSDAKGKMVKKIIHSVEKREITNHKYHEAYQKSMKNMTDRYEGYVREISSHDLTYYYKKEVMDTSTSM